MTTRPPVTVLFLDFDDVVFTMRSNYETWRTPELRVSDKVTDSIPDSVAIRVLNIACEKDDVQIVVTSTWDKGFDFDKDNVAHDALRKAGFTGTFYPDRFEHGRSNNRGGHIADFKNARPDIVRYLIIDDGWADMLPEQLPFTIPCDPEIGISKSNIRQILTFISGKELPPEHEDRPEIFARAFPNASEVITLRHDRDKKLQILKRRRKTWYARHYHPVVEGLAPPEDIKALKRAKRLKPLSF